MSVHHLNIELEVWKRSNTGGTNLQCLFSPHLELHAAEGLGPGLYMVALVSGKRSVAIREWCTVNSKS